jgi:hypothetical protein
MADTLTLQVDPDTAAEIRRMADQSGVSVEEMASLLLEQATAPDWPLSDKQRADLEDRLRNPGPFATEEEAERVLSRFRTKA